MIRILHLLDHERDFETQRSAQSLWRALGEGFDVTPQTIGRGGTWRNVATAAATLRRGDSIDRFDVVHAWGGAALAAAALGTRAGRILFSPSPQTHPRTVRWLRAVMAHRRVDVICPTTTLRRALVQRGTPFEQCHQVRPGVEFARVKRRRDPELRARLGLSESDFVFLAAGESTRAASHVEAVWAASILYVAYEKYKVLTWGRGPARQAVRNFAAHTMPGAFRDARQRLGGEVEFEELLPAADMVMVTARRAVATLPIAICMAAALPIVSTVTPTVAELLEDRHTALMTSGTPRQIARRALDLIEDPQLQWSLSDMARTEAYEYFSFTRFVNQFRTIYRQTAAGEKIEVPQDGPGAGLRFHGRT